MKFYRTYSYDANAKKITQEIEKITKYRERKKDLERRIKILEKSELFKDKNEIHQWLKDWRAVVNSENSDLMHLEKNLNEINPIYIPRNHQVQQAIDKAYENDFSKMLEMIDVVKRPFEEKPQYSSYAEAPLDEQKVQRTFCGT